MVDITHKSHTLRIATARATIQVGVQDTIDAIVNKMVPKGDVFAMSRAAGFLGIKKTPDLLPDCHPLPIECAVIDYTIEGLSIHVDVMVKTIYKTGVEVEAMHGASVVVLNMYDMLKPIDKNITIKTIQLLSKKGGKSDYKAMTSDQVKAVKSWVVVCSDSISAGENKDQSGQTACAILEEYGLRPMLQIIPDEPQRIQNIVKEAEQQNVQCLIFSGGTGVSQRDITPQTLKELLDFEMPGITEAMRRYGQDRMPYAMLSRSLAGVKNQTLIIALPGSVGGTKDSLRAVCPHIFHIFDVLKGQRHD